MRGPPDPEMRRAASAQGSPKSQSSVDLQPNQLSKAPAANQAETVSLSDEQQRKVIIRDRDAFMLAVLSRRDIKPNVKFLITAMLTHIDAKTGNCKVAASTLAKDLHCTARHIQRLLPKARATGLVDWSENKGGRGDSGNSYCFAGLLYGGSVHGSKHDHMMSDLTNSKYDQNEGASTTKIEVKYDQNRGQVRPHDVGRSGIQESGLSQASESDEDFENVGRKEEASQGGVRVEAESANQNLPLESPPQHDFGEFKAAYPRQEDDWGPTESRYRAVLKSGVTHAALMAGVTRLIRDSAGRKQKFITRADNWLFKHGWKSAEADTAAAQRLQRKFYAKDDSPELAAWDDYGRREKGKPYPRDKNGGWWFDSEWPPGHETTEAKIIRTWPMVGDKFHASVKSSIGA
jgi:hypothetical protein